MGLLDSLKGAYQRNKEHKELESSYIKTHKGTEAICAYMKKLFDVEQPAYIWLKKEKTPLYIKVYDDRVALCYTGVEGGGDRVQGAIPKDLEAAVYSFKKMYSWFGLQEGQGYSFLENKNQKDSLRDCIIEQIQSLPHIKYSTGFMVKNSDYNRFPLKIR